MAEQSQARRTRAPRASIASFTAVFKRHAAGISPSQSSSCCQSNKPFAKSTARDSDGRRQGLIRPEGHTTDGRLAIEIGDREIDRPRFDLEGRKRIDVFGFFLSSSFFFFFFGCLFILGFWAFFFSAPCLVFCVFLSLSCFFFRFGYLFGPLLDAPLGRSTPLEKIHD